MEKRDRQKAGERSQRCGRKRVGAVLEQRYSAAQERPGREEEAGQESLADGLIEGRNAVTEALRVGAPIDKIYVYPGHTFYFIIGADSLYEIEHWHEPEKVLAQAVILAAVREYASVEEILRVAEERGEAPLLVICDELSDPHNLGAVIRTAECAGAHGVIIPKRRSAGLTAVVAKTSAGAVSYLPVARVANLPALLKDLQKQGIWVFGTAADGNTDLYHADLKGPAAIVIGSEGDGMSRLVAQGCDFLVSIPMKGNISSLNASAAAAILLYEAVRQRMG